MTWKETDTDMKYRRLTGVMVSVAFLGLLTGCAGKESTEQRYAYPLGTASPEDTVTQIYAEKFAEEADRLSDGRIKITVYPNSVLGGEKNCLHRGTYRPMRKLHTMVMSTKAMTYHRI